MALVGFLVTLVVGLFLVCGAITVAVSARGLSGRAPPPYVWLLGGIGAAMVCLAVIDAPLTFMWTP